MHPRVFLDTFWRNDLKNEVFVAISLAPVFQERWEHIIVPAVSCEPIAGISLGAVRADLRATGDSILTTISDGIAHAQLVLADISVTHQWDDGGRIRHERNGNVMYEVGLALASRQPVEVILIRDDQAPLLFDVSSIPVLSFSPADVDQSIARIRDTLADRFRERELLKDLRVAAALESLAPFELSIIKQNPNKSVLTWDASQGLPPAVAMGLPGLLEKRILRRPTITLDVYEYTTFGRVVAARIWSAA